MTNYAEPRKGEEAPLETKGEGFRADEITVTHPAFAMIGVSRVSGHTNLFDSDFKHQHYMVVRIKRAELHRSLSRDWHFGREEYIEVALSESQWATFVSSPNAGDGVPCTLHHLQGKRAAGIPSMDRQKQIKGEIGKDLEDAVDDINVCLAELGNLGLSAKKLAHMKANLERAHRTLTNSIPFVVDQFAEHVENTVEKGKQEIHGYMTNAIHRAGLEALTDGKLPLQIEEDKE